MTDDTTPVGSVSPYTYQDRDGRAHEALLVPVEVTAIGTESEYPPPSFDEETLSSWMRNRYFFFEGDVRAQVPRQSSVFPFRCNEAQATDVVHRDDTVYIYYPVTADQAIALWWDYPHDRWDAELVDQPSTDDQIDLGEGHSADAEAVWSWRTRE